MPAFSWGAIRHTRKAMVSGTTGTSGTGETLLLGTSAQRFGDLEMTDDRESPRLSASPSDGASTWSGLKRTTANTGWGEAGPFPPKASAALLRNPAGFTSRGPVVCGFGA